MKPGPGGWERVHVGTDMARGKDPKEYPRPARCGDDKDGGAEWWDESITSKLHVVHMYLDCLSACVSESLAHET